MGLRSMYERAEKLADPIDFDVADGQRETFELGNVSGFRIVRKSTSTGTVLFVGRQTDPGEEATEGYEVTEDAPDSGWILADATRFVRIKASGGTAVGQIWRQQDP